VTTSVTTFPAGNGSATVLGPARNSTVTVLTGQSLTTSWWSHPEARLIFAVLSDLSDHPDVLFTKLVQRKVTLVHRSLWPALLAVAAAGEPWQLDRLSAPARALLSVVNGSKEAVRCSGKPAKEIEARLLAHATQVHTESGRHEVKQCANVCGFFLTSAFCRNRLPPHSPT